MSQILFTLSLSSRIEAFVQLGKHLSALSEEERLDLARRARFENAWFIDSSVLLALKNLALMLEEDALVNFVLNYKGAEREKAIKRIGVVMAGNIPAVGFHDALCVLLAGHVLKAKLSKDDTVLMRFLLQKLVEIEPRLQNFIQIVDRLSDMDAVICTGSNNSARYFEHYFGKYPHIIRRNRTSVAVLDGNESETDLKLLANDIFTYGGLGCRNVSKLFLPEGQDITKVIDAFEFWSHIIDQHKYANNYTYNRAVLLLNLEPFLDNNFLLLKESESLHSPLSVLHYERYKDEELLLRKLEEQKGEIQCIVSNLGSIQNKIPFGEAQHPAITDYADGVDTMDFLLRLA